MNVLSPWNNLFNSSVQELIAFIDTQKGSDQQNWYAQVLVCFFMGECLELTYLIRKYPQSGDPLQDRILLNLARCRLNIRRNTYLRISEQELLKDTSDHSVFRPEAFAVAGMQAEYLGDFHKANEHYLKSYLGFKTLGLTNRSALMQNAWLNSEVHNNPEERFLPRMIEILKSHQDNGALQAAGSLALNISYEFEYIGSLRTAYRYALMAENSLYGFRGTKQYDLSVAQLAHLSFQLGNTPMAQKLMERLDNSKVAPARAASQILKKWYIDENIKLTEPPSAAWKNKMKLKDQSVVRLTELEDNIVNLTSQGIVSKADLLIHLYPDEKARTSDLRRRIDSAIYKLRKKVPEIVINDQGNYSMGAEAQGVV
ncbi:MAG: hypothetical protein CL677_05575 [Bdellovibrionaceae bacterium]|nr:hypothetical protein [Pseudobdellovibrionaceae bacterium]|tara:strand:+ start:335 stop:1444 length:1110 start_codon:yes stop_codon:yes gene_type:complete